LVHFDPPVVKIVHQNIEPKFAIKKAVQPHHQAHQPQPQPLQAKVQGVHQFQPFHQDVQDKFITQVQEKDSV